MNMGRVITTATNRYPERTAVVDPADDVRYTYDEWRGRIHNIAGSLEKQGFGTGRRIAIAMRNREEAVSLYAASQLLGATFIPLDFRSTAEEFEYFVNHSKPDVLVYGASAADSVEAASGSFETDTMLLSVDEANHGRPLDAVLESDDNSFESTYVDADETSIILYTAGTTGDPKGVPRSHKNTYCAAAAHATQTSWSQRESTLGIGSIFHTMGLHALATILLLSGKWVVQRRFSPERSAELIEQEEVTSLYLVPTFYHEFVGSDAVFSECVSSVDKLAFAGADMTQADIENLTDLFDPDVFVNHYGSTEVYTHTVNDRVSVRESTVGRAGINSQVRIVEPSEFGGLNPEKTVDQGDLGEIVVDASSPEAFDGYLDEDGVESETAHTLSDGWFFTGDLGYRDETGDIVLVGRVDNMIISGGENIYPVEVETVLESHDLVDEAAVVGRPSERWNQTVAAFVTLDTDVSAVDFESAARELDAHCVGSSEISDFKRPRKYFFIEKLVKSNVGKILRKELQKPDLDVNVFAEIEL